MNSHQAKTCPVQPFHDRHRREFAALGRFTGLLSAYLQSRIQLKTKAAQAINIANTL